MIEKYLKYIWIPVAAVVVYFAYSSYLQSRDDRVRMEQTLTLLGTQIKQSQAQIEANAQALQATLEELEQQRAAVKTPQQAATAIPQVITGVQPVIVQVPAPVGQLAQPVRAEIPLEQLTTLYNFAMDCKECGIKLTAAEKDKTELATQTKLLTLERDEAVKAVRGGTFWQRLGRTMKTVAITAAIVVPVAFVAGRSSK